MKEMMRNFTAILPVTCNADCSFCPEKEMDDEDKAPSKFWLSRLIKQINAHHGEFDHVSLSGGEATLRPKFLFEVIDAIKSQTNIRRVGLTSNGYFLNKAAQTFQFLDLNTNDMLESKLDHLNISRHSFDDALNNRIMAVRYTYTLDDLIRFRRQLGRKLSFHINFVINEHNIENIVWEFEQANTLMQNNSWIDVVFRVDYNDTELNRELREYGQAMLKYNECRKPRGLKPKAPKLVRLFDAVFDGSYTGEDGTTQRSGESTFTDACPSCFTHRSVDLGGSFAYLKASSFEPNDDEPEFTEFVFHMDGKLYYDWSRNTPVKRNKTKAVKRRSRKKFDLECKEEEQVKKKKKVAPVDDMVEDDETNTFRRRDQAIEDIERGRSTGRCGFPTTRCGY